MGAETLRDHIRSLQQPTEAVLLEGQVTSVDPDQLVCDVQPVREDEPEVFGVRLNASFGNSLTPIPAQDSYVVIGMLNSNDAFVAQFGEVDAYRMKVQDLELKLEDGKVLLQSGDLPIELSKSQISLGGKGTQPAVLGTTLETQLNQLISQLQALNSALQAFAGAQNTAANSAGVLAPLVPGYSALSSALPPVISGLTQLQGQLSKLKAFKTVLK